MTMSFPGLPECSAGPLHLISWWMKRGNGRISWNSLKTKPRNGMLYLFWHSVYSSTKVPGGCDMDSHRKKKRWALLLEREWERPLVWARPFRQIPWGFPPVAPLPVGNKTTEPRAKDALMLEFSGKVLVIISWCSSVLFPGFTFPKAL